MSGASAHPLRFAGYAALFDIADAARDTIRPGAFAQTLGNRRGPIPLFWQHRSDAAIGVVETIAEDPRGLRVIGQIDNHFGRAAQMLRRGEVSGLSFGYRASGYQRSRQGRILTAIDLFEVSLVTRPLQHGARVHFVAQNPPRHGEVAAFTKG